jgi:hypothetical protein
MTRRNDDNDDPRDAHLLAALRHAPDRDALPPREVSERILAAARAAVRPARETSASWGQRLGAWLTQPQVAAAFGTLAVASLVGVMWSTREPPVAEFVPNAPLADAAGRVDQRSMAPAPALSTPAEAAKPDAGGVAAASAGRNEARDKIAEAPPPKAIGKDAAARTQSRVRSKAETPAAPAAATTAPTTPPIAPSPPPAAAPVRQAADAAADASAPAAVAERRSANEGDLQGLARQQGTAASRSASAATLGMSLAAKARAAEPLAAIDAALAAGARWQVAGLAGGRQHGDAQRAFWASMKEATQGHWEAVQPTVPTAPWLMLEQGSPGATLWVMNGALHITAQGQTWRAPVDAARLADWQEQVARW